MNASTSDLSLRRDSCQVDARSLLLRAREPVVRRHLLASPSLGPHLVGPQKHNRPLSSSCCTPSSFFFTIPTRSRFRELARSRAPRHLRRVATAASPTETSGLQHISTTRQASVTHSEEMRMTSPSPSLKRYDVLISPGGRRRRACSKDRL